MDPAQTELTVNGSGPPAKLAATLSPGRKLWSSVCFRYLRFAGHASVPVGSVIGRRGKLFYVIIAKGREPLPGPTNICNLLSRTRFLVHSTERHSQHVKQLKTFGVSQRRGHEYNIHALRPGIFVRIQLGKNQLLAQS